MDIGTAVSLAAIVVPVSVGAGAALFNQAKRLTILEQKTESHETLDNERFDSIKVLLTEVRDDVKHLLK